MQDAQPKGCKEVPQVRLHAVTVQAREEEEGLSRGGRAWSKAQDLRKLFFPKKTFMRKRVLVREILSLRSSRVQIPPPALKGNAGGKIVKKETAAIFLV